MPRSGGRSVVLAAGLALGALAAAGAGAGWWWATGGPNRQGFEAAAPGACPARAAAVSFPAPARSDLDRYVLPIGPPPVAPVNAVVCRYGVGGALLGGQAGGQPGGQAGRQSGGQTGGRQGGQVAGLRLDPARTASLAAAFAAPVQGWPDDALAAKHPAPLSAADLATATAPPCVDDGTAEIVRFAYAHGPMVVVRVRLGSCQDLSNGALTRRLPRAVSAALAALP